MQRNTAIRKTRFKICNLLSYTWVSHSKWVSDHYTFTWNLSVHWIKHVRPALCAWCSQRVMWASYLNTWTLSTSKRMCNSREPQTFEQIILCQNVVRISKSNVYTCHEGSRSWRLSDFQTIGTWKISSCQPYAPATFTPKKIFLILTCVRGLVDLRSTVQPTELSPWKITMTASGIEPATFRCLAQYTTNCATGTFFIRSDNFSAAVGK
jgi:hypothetical protein